MIRITTHIGDRKVRTLSYNGVWYTFIAGSFRSSTASASNLLDAGRNHLQAASMLRDEIDRSQ